MVQLDGMEDVYSWGEVFFTLLLDKSKRLELTLWETEPELTIELLSESNLRL